MLADQAQVNLAAITYYFGGKEGLYRAVADHIVQKVGELLGPKLTKAKEALKKDTLSKEESFNLFGELLDFFITGFLGRPETDKWLSIIVREQLCPTEAFDILYQGFMGPLQETLFNLVERIIGPTRDDLEVKLRVFAIMGQILIFHTSPSSIKRTLNWEAYRAENIDVIRRIISDNLSRIFSMSRNLLT